MSSIEDQLGQQRIELISFDLRDHIIEDDETVLIEELSFLLGKLGVVQLIHLVHITSKIN